MLLYWCFGVTCYIDNKRSERCNLQKRMARNLVRATIHKHCFKVYVGGLIFCIFVIILLAVCNSSIENPNRSMQKGRESGHYDGTESVQARQVLSHEKTQNLKLAVFVMSAPSHLENRNVIRQTWALTVPKNIQVYFVLGTGNLIVEEKKSILNEKEKYHDLVVLDNFEESYSTLTIKLVETLKWVDSNLHTEYFMKVDEDTFVRLDQVLMELQSKPKEMMYWGFFDGRAHVKKTGKWAEKEFVLCDRYLPYALGGGYVLSSDLVHYVAVNSDMFQMFNSEDVSLGTWLAPLKIRRLHDPHFNTEFRSRGCFNSYIVTHKQTMDSMKELNRSLNVNGRLCESEYRSRLSYVYNWDNLPTNCCIREDPSIP